MDDNLVLGYNAGEERARLFKRERRPELELKFAEMQRDINALLGQRIRDVLLRNPSDHRSVLALCMEAEEEEAEIQRVLNEGLEAEAAELKDSHFSAALNHPGEADPSHMIRERLKGPQYSASASTTYCSPVLMKTLFWENMDQIPDTHRKRLELDFPARVESLLDFHCIAFHADVNVMKALYDDDVQKNKEKRDDILKNHRAKMEGLMNDFAKEMKKDWSDEIERRSRLSLDGAADFSGSYKEKRDRVSSTSPPTTRGVAMAATRKRAHMADTPTIIGPASQKPRTDRTLPGRGILKNAHAAVSSSRAAPSDLFSQRNTTTLESTLFKFEDDDDDDGFGEGFFTDALVDERDALGRMDSTYRGPEIVDASTASGHPPSTSGHFASANQRFVSASDSLPGMHPTYEIFRPSTQDDAFASTPRAASNVAKLTQRFEEREEKERGKGKGRVATRK